MASAIWCEKYKAYKEHACVNCVGSNCGPEPGIVTVKPDVPVERVVSKHPALGMPYSATTAIPPGEWNLDKIIAMVREDLKQRSEFGLSKYGRPLDSRHDFDLPTWLKYMYEELLDAANYAKCMMVYGVGYFRKVRQAANYAHGRDGFGAEYATPVNRAIRLFEEAVECIQAAGVERAKAHDLVQYGFDRPKGDIAIEIGQVGLTLGMLAESLGIDAEKEEAAETERFLARSVESMQARLKEKLEGGMPVAEK